MKKIKRHFVPAGQISWDVPFDHYDPMTFDAPVLTTAPWADPDITTTEFKPKYNFFRALGFWSKSEPGAGAGAGPGESPAI